MLEERDDTGHREPSHSCHDNLLLAHPQDLLHEFLVLTVHSLCQHPAEGVCRGRGTATPGEGKGEWIHSLHIYSSREEGMVEGTSMGGVLDGDLLMIPRLQ